MSIKLDKSGMFWALCKSIVLITLISIIGVVYAFRGEVRELMYHELSQTETQALYQGKIQNMDDILGAYLKTDQDAKAISVYKFIPYNESVLYKGQMNILTSSKEKDFSLNEWKPELHAVDSSAQDVLFNKVHYETITSVRVVCDKIYNASTTYSCEKYKVISEDFKSIVTIPIMDTQTYAVTGYVMILLQKEYDNTEVQNMVTKLRPYIEKIQPFVTSITKDEIPTK